MEDSERDFPDPYSMRGIPLDELIEETKKRIQESKYPVESPVDFWLRTMESMEQIVGFFTESVEPDELQIPIIGPQVVAFEAMLDAFKMQVIHEAIFRQAREAGISFPEMLMKLEKEQEEREEKEANGVEG